VVQGTDGSFYGTAVAGGAEDNGTVFKITPSGRLTTLHTFLGSPTDGANPYAGLVQGADGNFYGTTSMGGTGLFCKYGCGTIFKITPSGRLTTLHSFDGTDGSLPYAGLVQAANGTFYGATERGGANGGCNGGEGCGTVFKITPSGTLTILHSFDKTDGSLPDAGLVQAANGAFYGTTEEGGANGYGTVYKITLSGALTTLHSFDKMDGSCPYAGLIQATDGSFYGTTVQGGANGGCRGLGCGTVFKITANGNLMTLYNFGKGGHGNEPFAGLIQGTDGNFYGTTGGDGFSGDYGKVFKITRGGKLTTLHEFDGAGYSDGEYIDPGLVQGTDGTFYGAGFGGANGYGVVYSLSVGLGAFVTTHPTSGEVGKAVKILGTNLTGATSVTFNGTAATFTVKSSSEIATTVPTGATTGTVQVVTPGGTLSSNVPFRVK
jgi:uncharacterized repeat protein (TIGR03803 family)